jgi:cytidine deaminase
MNAKTVDRLIEQLKPEAVRACGHAYAPYSQFPVGAALVTDNGKIYSGCNVENASFGLTICAERNALAPAVGQGMRPGGVQAMLIYTPGDVAHSPCGACRQVMHELLGENAVVVSCCDGDQNRTWNMQQLIPDPFEL